MTDCVSSKNSLAPIPLSLNSACSCCRVFACFPYAALSFSLSSSALKVTPSGGCARSSMSSATGTASSSLGAHPPS